MLNKHHRLGRVDSPATGNVSGQDVRRGHSELDRRSERLEHGGLSGRAASMPHHGGTRPLRGALPSVQLGSPNQTRSLLETGERSDRYSIEAHPSEADWAEVLAAMRDVQAEEAPTVQPAPERSWRAMLGGVAGQVGQAARKAGGWIGGGGEAILQGVKAQVSAFDLVKPKGRLLGAAAGHLIHQSVAVGVPTFLREMMAEAAVLSLRHMPPHHAVALQVVAGAASVSVQFLRRAREARNPDAAARGFHAMPQEQWNQLPDAKKAELRRQQDVHSRMVTNLQVMASATHIAVGVFAARGDNPDPEKAVKLAVTDIKAFVYAGMRDSLQASFGMVGTARDTHGGVSGAHMAAAATFYAMASASANYAFTYLPSLVPGMTAADAVLRGTSTAMSHAEAWMTKASVAAVKAAINVVAETSDWFSVTQQEANQAGTVQQWNPKLKFLSPESRDYDRLLDQSPARITAIHTSNALINAISLAMKDSPEWARVAASNLVGGASEGLKYKTILATWQAGAAVRAEPVPAEEVDLEAGHEHQADRGKAIAGQASHA